MGLILEDIINRHGLYITTNTDFTYQQSTMVSKSGKSTIDLTLTCGLQNIKVVTKDFTLIKTRYKVTEQEPSFKPNPKFKTKSANWEKWKQVSSRSTSRRLVYKLPLRNFRKSHWSTDQQIDRTNSGFCKKFFLLWQKYQIRGPKVGGIKILKLSEKRWMRLWKGIYKLRQQTYEKWYKSRKNTKLPFLRKNSNNLNLTQNS